MFTYSVLMGNRTIITMSGLHVNTNYMSLLLHQSVTLDPQALEFVIIMPIILYLQTHINGFCGVFNQLPRLLWTYMYMCIYLYIHVHNNWNIVMIINTHALHIDQVV